METGTKIRISQCMIVKNEQQNIEKALSWGKNVVWEQIVVDTGSTDETVELAKRMGAKVFFMEWTEDFAAAKNYAIDKADGEWIVFLDADEYMTEEDAQKLPEIFRQLSCGGNDGVTALLHNMDDTGRIFSSCSHLRFFRNIPEIRYRRRIHEQIVSLSGRELQIMDGTRSLSIFHTGYQESVSAEKKKSDRNRKLLEREMEEYPEDPELMGYMGDECFDIGEMEKAEWWYRKAICYMPQKFKIYDQRSAVTFARLIRILTEGEGADWTKARVLYEQAVQFFPEEPDFDYLAGRYFVSQEQFADGAGYLETALGKLKQYGYVNRALLLTGNLGDAYVLLARCCYYMGEMQKCVSYAVDYLKYDRYEIVLLSWLLRVLCDGQSVKEETDRRSVLEFLSRIYDFTLLKDRLFLVKAAEKAGCKTFAQYAECHIFTAEEREILGI